MRLRRQVVCGCIWPYLDVSGLGEEGCSLGLWVLGRQIPVLEMAEGALFESSAIMRYGGTRIRTLKTVGCHACSARGNPGLLGKNNLKKRMSNSGLARHNHKWVELRWRYPHCAPPFIPHSFRVDSHCLLGSVASLHDAPLYPTASDPAKDERVGE